MNKKVFLPLVLLPLLLGGCNQSLSYFNDNRRYNSNNWKNDYYRVYDSSYNGASKRREVSLKDEEVFTSFGSTLFKEIDPEGSKKELFSEDYEYSYSMERCLCNIDDSFKFGVSSKLFDGKMFCNGRYEAVRTQIDETGFGLKFEKKVENYSYFAINFRSDLNFKDEIVPAHVSSFTLKIRFLFEENNNYVYDLYTYRFNDLPTNADHYVFFGFSLKNYSIKDCVGMSIAYSDFVDDYNNSLATKKDHALLIYEALLPYSTWLKY